MSKIKLSEGDQAPNFEAVDQDGEVKNLNDYKGKYLLLYFYPADNTPGCVKEACSFRNSYEDLKKYVEVLGVSKNSQKSHQNFASKYDLPFPLLVDDKKEIAAAYGADGVFFPRRVSFLIGPDQTVKKIYEKINVVEHVSDVLQDVADLY